ncbi:MAG: hypothetical protein JKY61_01860 [Planctomycetes bacterium]|nr:hypothetical protein [Planctomycetota bacterium]
MKHFVLLAGLLIIAPFASAQQTSQSTQKPFSPAFVPSSSRASCTPIGGTGLCVPLDSTFDVVPFGSSSGCGNNDDGSQAYTLNGWLFDHFGTLTDDFFINNNGNVSIGVSFNTFSASGFPINGFPMLAPFWGDVDTRGTASGNVWTREWSTANGDPINRLVVTWDNVGYYNSATDKLNTFQIILTDGNDPLIGAGNNVCFCYEDMQWTTGSASQGVGGFGGIPATVGANEGNGVDFFLVGRFDQAGNAYDGPAGNNDGVDFLDNSTFCFSVGGGGSNLPPVFLNPSTCDLVVGVGNTLNFDIQAIGPESGQTVDIIVSGSPADFTFNATNGNPGIASCTFSPSSNALLGRHVVTFTAQDDGVPVRSSIIEVEIQVVAGASMGSTFCASEVNSTGAMGHLELFGTDVATDDRLSLQASNLPANQTVLFIASDTPVSILHPGGYGGILCVGGSFARFNSQIMNSSACGRAAITVDTTDMRANPSRPILAGETWHFQAWHREPGMAPATFTDAASVMFQ